MARGKMAAAWAEGSLGESENEMVASASGGRGVCFSSQIKAGMAAIKSDRHGGPLGTIINISKRANNQWAGDIRQRKRINNIERRRKRNGEIRRDAEEEEE